MQVFKTQEIDQVKFINVFLQENRTKVLISPIRFVGDKFQEFRQNSKFEKDY